MTSRKPESTPAVYGRRDFIRAAAGLSVGGALMSGSLNAFALEGSASMPFANGERPLVKYLSAQALCASGRVSRRNRNILEVMSI